jgi:glycerol-1-phosphate dehydrogenase [NAD(P)+]
MSPALEAALRAARDTKRLELGRGALARAGDVFAETLPGHKPVMVCDPATFKAGFPRTLGAVAAMFQELHADWESFEAVHGALAKEPADTIPVAVGSGTINDLVKLAAHRLGRPYMCVATAASMDGYTAYGASITKDGSKQTFDCPAPRAVVADLDVIAAAPNELTASGYADLLAKVTAGADWVLADALGVEPIDEKVWAMVQSPLHASLALPVDIEKLTEGLLASGFAMQAHQTSRPASGAEHQFSHLWDMQAATDASHGFKVGVGTLAVTRMYENILDQPIEMLDIEDCARRWRDWPAVEASIRRLFAGHDELRDKAIEETRVKLISRDELVTQLVRLRDGWPDLKRRLREQLIPSPEVAGMLQGAGAPAESTQIGISADQLALSHRLAYHIRRRFTVLDLAERIGMLGHA